MHHQARSWIQRARGKGAFEIHRSLPVTNNTARQRWMPACSRTLASRQSAMMSCSRTGAVPDFQSDGSGQVDGAHRDAEGFQGGGAVLTKTPQTADQHQVKPLASASDGLSEGSMFMRSCNIERSSAPGHTPTIANRIQALSASMPSHNDRRWLMSSDPSILQIAMESPSFHCHTSLS